MTIRTRNVDARRSYKARDTAHVSTIQRQIERVFESSRRLCPHLPPVTSPRERYVHH